jgi:hypothetical protein
LAVAIIVAVILTRRWLESLSAAEEVALWGAILVLLIALMIRVVVGWMRAP